MASCGFNKHVPDVFQTPRVSAMKFLRPIFVLVLASIPLQAADWPQWLGPNRDGSSVEIVKPWTESPKVLWRVPVGEGHSSPIVADGKVILHHKVAGKDE